MSLCRCFIDQPLFTNSTASQSSRAGWLGGSDWVPKSSGETTIPRPISSAHQRFTVTRATSGFFGDTSHLAKPSRLRGHSFLNPCSTPGVSAVTASPGERYSPRFKTRVDRPLSISTITSVVCGLMAATFLEMFCAFSSCALRAGNSDR